MEMGVQVAESAFLDLGEIEVGRRTGAWDGMIRGLFPGISVHIDADGPQAGRVDRFAMGQAELCLIESAPAEVRYRPPGSAPTPPPLSLMVQSCGHSLVAHGGASARLREGDMCLIDEQHGFRLETDDFGGILFLRLPRGAALSRYPDLERLFGTVLSGDHCGTRVLADTLVSFSRHVGQLGESQRLAMIGSMIQLLGVTEPIAMVPDAGEWRVQRAVEFIELNLSVARLTAEDIANDQRISRRRLDQLMHEKFGCSIAGYLWRRRMEQAAEDLRDPRKAQQSVSQIAFANGFEDGAHFSRAFKRRFELTPGRFRVN
ncbi:helix-turn-helix domain-containing protein [Altererythrobacter xixiisoli]|uniref:Helix-turn-helix domain-containing protein n=1 Tax=Croceibacterium xixiisoli TaxID=1476466 RepID=A0A6I4TVZ2_9SPHN|nr:helix-turn-helix domain-containing protein [Croceibacterium xixiisoli]MXP00227.1 helix-turn-helix domain-containing protein [Croceibacterium xixiisoli]